MLSEVYLRGRRSQRGQTILLVAISMVSLLAMAALAIDVVTLYVARTEIQRAADAAALVGAKAIADSGMTTLPSGSADLASATALAQSMADSAIAAMVSASATINNQVAGNPPTLVNKTYNFTPNNNPTVTVTFQQTNLPTFFARIFGQRSATTGASATAEAYNPSNMANFTPIAPRCVKPWLVANRDPTHVQSLGPPVQLFPFIDETSGAVVADLATLAATNFDLKANCHTGTPSCIPFTTSMTGQPNPNGWLHYAPSLVTPSPADTCPACTGASNFEEGTACCNVATYSCGGSATNAIWDSTINPDYNPPASRAASATQCLIHASTTGPAQGQDQLDYPSPWPGGPPRITAGTAGPISGQVVTTSSSIVTIPIINRNLPGSTTGPVTVVGFLHAFVNFSDDFSSNSGEINITVLNVIGCSATPNGNAPVVGGNGASAIPVRLITPQ